MVLMTFHFGEEKPEMKHVKYSVWTSSELKILSFHFQTHTHRNILNLGSSPERMKNAWPRVVLGRGT